MEHQTVIAETDRLMLRRYKKEDLQDLFAYLSDAEVVKYEPQRPLTLEETEDGLCSACVSVGGEEIHRLCREIFLAFAARKAVLLELTPKKADLEDVFLQLSDTGQQTTGAETGEEEAV